MGKVPAQWLPIFKATIEGTLPFSRFLAWMDKHSWEFYRTTGEISSFFPFKILADILTDEGVSFQERLPSDRGGITPDEFDACTVALRDEERPNASVEIEQETDILSWDFTGFLAESGLEVPRIRDETLDDYYDANRRSYPLPLYFRRFWEYRLSALDVARIDGAPVARSLRISRVGFDAGRNQALLGLYRYTAGEFHLSGHTSHILLERSDGGWRAVFRQVGSTVIT